MIPTPIGAVVLNPSTVVISWNGYRRSFDLGALTYLSRNLVARNQRFFAPPTTERDPFIRRLVQVLSEMHEVDEHRASTQLNFCQQIKLFLDWVDARASDIHLHNPESVEPHAREYIAALNVQVRLGTLNHNTAAGKGNELRTILRRVFGLPEWGSTLPILKESHRATNSTQVPAPQLQALAYAIAQVLFEGVADFLH